MLLNVIKTHAYFFYLHERDKLNVTQRERARVVRKEGESNVRMCPGPFSGTSQSSIQAHISVVHAFTTSSFGGGFFLLLGNELVLLQLMPEQSPGRQCRALKHNGN